VATQLQLTNTSYIITERRSLMCVIYIAVMFLPSLMEIRPLIRKSEGELVPCIPSVRNKFLVKNCH
jgi:hypothetical protein